MDREREREELKTKNTMCEFLRVEKIFNREEIIQMLHTHTRQRDVRFFSSFFLLLEFSRDRIAK